MSAGVDFPVREYTASGTFQEAHYQFSEGPDGWTVRRNGNHHLYLGPGYHCLETTHCGVCSTDLARHFLPYPLPQIIGHEVVAKRNGRSVVVEINASHKARGLDTDCVFCGTGMDTQCPDRITMGIDRLPGGFAPWILAPSHGVVDIPPPIPDDVAALAEPFAAALHALDVTPVDDAAGIAVLGPRRLGSLLIAALDIHRRETGAAYKITALVRRPQWADLARGLGADDCIDMQGKVPPPDSFDVVFDTTGNPEGLEIALRLARHTVHLKSTHGRGVCGMHHLSDMVVEEISLIPGNRQAKDFSWIGEHRRNAAVLVLPGAAKDDDLPSSILMSAAEALEHVLGGAPTASPYGRFDLAVVGSLTEADNVIRPDKTRELSLVRPRGAIVLQNAGMTAANPISQALAAGKRIHTSRCGDMRTALGLLARHPETVSAMARMLTHTVPIEEIDRAFGLAASPESVKVLVKTQS